MAVKKKRNSLSGPILSQNSNGIVQDPELLDLQKQTMRQNLENSKTMTDLTTKVLSRSLIMQKWAMRIGIIMGTLVLLLILVEVGFLLYTALSH